MGLEIFSSESLGVDFAALDPMLVPCASRITLHDGREIGGDDDCIWDKQEVLDYIGKGYNLITYFNQMGYNEEEFDKDKRIKRNSELAVTFSASQ